jgi:glycosyltransferase involved in cell wall biosynthesis
MENDAQTEPKKRVKNKRNVQKIRRKPTISASPIQREVAEILCLSSYPPRECGIATFSHDLQKSLEQKFNGSLKMTMCPLETDSERYSYPDEVKYRLNTDSERDFIGISRLINRDPNIVLVLVQHEFGLFKNKEKAFVDFLHDLNKPVVVTFHTVLPEPDSALKKKVRRIAKECSGIVVMTQTSKEILKRDYQIDEGAVEVIPHGTHLVPYENQDFLKAKYDLSGQTVLTTFGLLGPGKNIETTLRALPNIVEEFPNVVFLIIGKTHPSLVRDFGEDYRLFLESLVEKFNLQDHVKFIDRFIPTPQLLEYLQLTDIYLFTSKDPKQAVSGTFAYALSCGCPVVSTPIPHALEVLQNEAGVVFDFCDSDQLEQAVLDLLDDYQTLENMSLNGLHTSAASAWENAALAHAKLFERLANGEVKLKYRRPPLDLKHLKKMTTEVGIAQFCKINQPDMAYGYTLDDNARALIAFCRHYKITGDAQDLEYIKRYFRFVAGCFRPDGKFWNYVDEDCRFTEQNEEVNLEDANGRAIWALGVLLSIVPKFPERYRGIGEKAEFLLNEALPRVRDIESPRAMAFIIKGLCYYALENGRLKVETTIETMADRLTSLYRNTASGDWQWFEKYLTYGNAVIPHALLMASVIAGKSAYRKVAKTTFDFLLDKIFTDTTIRVISNKNWLSKGEPFEKSFQGGEQPIDVAYTILALDLFALEFPEAGYGRLKQRAFDWFLGNNPLRQTIYNPCTGGCYDGLELNNVNLNQGAESTISYLLARMSFGKNR